jgi:hypothetical protein
MSSNARHRRIDCLFLNNRGSAEQCRGDAPADRFSVFGPQPPGAGHTSFLFGIAVSAVTSLGLHVLVTDLQPAASRAADARRTIARLRRKVAFGIQDHDNRLDHQQRTDRMIRRRRPTGS